MSLLAGIQHTKQKAQSRNAQAFTPRGFIRMGHQTAAGGSAHR